MEPTIMVKAQKQIPTLQMLGEVRVMAIVAPYRGQVESRKPAEMRTNAGTGSENRLCNKLSTDSVDHNSTGKTNQMPVLYS